MAIWAGVDFGGTEIKGVVCEDGVILHKDSIFSEVLLGPDETIERLVQFTRKLIADHPVRGVGVAVCGPVDRRRGVLLRTPVLPEWPEIAVLDRLGPETGVPVVIENDSNCAILGEWWGGAAVDSPIVVGFTLGTGIGGGIVIDGEILEGAAGYGGELGHIAVEEEPACPCGGRGCLQVLASAAATVRRYREYGGEPVDGTEDLVRRADAGDERAARALELSVRYIGQGAKFLINVFNPHVFVLAGGLSNWGDPLVSRVRSALIDATFPALQRTPVRAAALGSFSGAVGVSCLIARKATAT